MQIFCFNIVRLKSPLYLLNMKNCLNCRKTVKNLYCNVLCQNTHQNTKKANDKYGEFRQYNVECYSCSNFIIINEREKLFPSKEKYFCSKSCANKREFKEETKKKISETFKNKPKKEFTFECLNCAMTKILIDNKKNRAKKFCSISCSTKYKNITLNMCQKGGLKSYSKQNKRSKNEILFHELCENYFYGVTNNEQFFNGWDADVILHEHKIAILWNGIWHYKKITKNHSLEQVQNRDKIKVLEIEKFGYEPYIIKDMGKFNKNFVMSEFIKLIEFIKEKNQSK